MRPVAVGHCRCVACVDPSARLALAVLSGSPSEVGPVRRGRRCHLESGNLSWSVRSLLRVLLRLVWTTRAGPGMLFFFPQSSVSVSESVLSRSDQPAATGSPSLLLSIRIGLGGLGPRVRRCLRTICAGAFPLAESQPLHLSIFFSSGRLSQRGEALDITVLEPALSSFRFSSHSLLPPPP